MRAMTRVFTATILATLICGCASRRTYDVTVRNDLDKAVTLWLTKDGPPSEEGWQAPEEFIFLKNIDEVASPCVIVPPGKTANTGPISGKFPKGTNGILRVYVGETKFAEILRQQNGRIDLKLEPGVNKFVLRDKNGEAVVDPLKQ